MNIWKDPRKELPIEDNGVSFKHYMGDFSFNIYVKLKDIDVMFNDCSPVFKEDGLEDICIGFTSCLHGEMSRYGDSLFEWADGFIDIKNVSKWCYEKDLINSIED